MHGSSSSSHASSHATPATPTAQRLGARTAREARDDTPWTAGENSERVTHEVIMRRSPSQSPSHTHAVATAVQSRDRGSRASDDRGRWLDDDTDRLADENERLRRQVEVLRAQKSAVAEVLCQYQPSPAKSPGTQRAAALLRKEVQPSGARRGGHDGGASPARGRELRSLYSAASASFL